MIYLHKLLPLLLSPLVLALAAIGYGAWRKRWRWAVGAALGLYALSAPVLSNALFRAVEGHALRQPALAQPTADAVVVLGGSLSHVPGPQGVVPEWLDGDRFFGGLELLRAGKAPQIVFTRGLLPWSATAHTEGETLRRLALQMGVAESAVRLTAQEVQNTAQEAQAVAQTLPAGQRRILLVTSAFHMPRAQALFEQAGFDVLPYPVDFKVELAKTKPTDFLPDAHALFLSDLAMREWLGRGYYAVRHGLGLVEAL